MSLRSWPPGGPCPASQSVSVVPMIQCRPHGMTNSTRFSVRRISPVLGADPVARHDEVDALARADVELAALAGQRLRVVGPDAGGVDRPAGPGPRTSSPVSRSRDPGAGDPLALAQEARRPGPGWRRARRTPPRCGPGSSCAGRRRPGRRSTAARRPARPCAATGPSRSAPRAGQVPVARQPAGACRRAAPSRRRARRPAPA